MNADLRIEELREKITYHNDKYYNQDNSEISDYDYDMLMQELKKIEKEHPELITADSPTQIVGGAVKRQAGIVVKHRVPMLSLQDVFKKEDVYQFVEDIQKQFNTSEFVVENKIDGLSMVLRYVNGNLDVAVTRGDGIIEGEDVTQNAKVIKDVKIKLKEEIPYLEIRGEVYLTNRAFEAINERQEILGGKIFANPRNCAAGALRQLDSKITKERELSLFIFNVQDVKGKEFKTHTEGYEFLKRQGIKVIDHYIVCKTADEVWNAIEKIGKNRGDLEYGIDGAVVKVNNIEYRKILGSTSKVPKWAIAYKYPPEEKETKLIDVEFSVGRTGRITPTAIFKYLNLCGTSVSRATLHNQDFIDDLDIRMGDTIIVYKSGEIIPKIKGVLKEKRLNGQKRFKIPHYCPVCGNGTIREPGTSDTKCVNPNCPSQLEKHIINFVGRNAMDIKGFGPAYVQELVKLKYITSVADIYNLYKYREELIEKAVIGKEKNTNKLLESIEKSKANEPDRILTGLGIPNIGKAAAKAIMKHFESIDNLQDAPVEKLKEVRDIGETSAISVRHFFDDEENRAIIQRLKEYEVNLTVTEGTEIKDNRFESKTFVITGTLPKMERPEATKLIESYGGKVSGSVSKKTNYVLAGENAGNKLTNAQALNIAIITEEDLMNMIK